MSATHNSASVVGIGNTVIQTIGGPGAQLDLTLAFEELHPGQPHSLAHLLKWNGRISPLHGRDGELAQLRAWLADPHAGPVQVISGPGGAGKTRLAAEFARELCETAPPEPQGWLDKLRSRPPSAPL